MLTSQTITLSLSPQTASSNQGILEALRNKINIEDTKSLFYRIKKRSIDARRKPIKINLELLISENKEDIDIQHRHINYEKLSENAPQVVIVGSGPAGLFAALRAIELGIKPIIVERGKDVDERRKDIAKISRENKIDKNSNFCFGEGGAGTFSDGKLFTRSKKRGNNRQILDILYQFGADEDILINSHPHIGSDRLPQIIKNIRKKIIECGGEVRFNTKMKDLIIENKKVLGIITDKDERILGPVFLAIGHSSRDTYRSLLKSGVKMEPKGLAIGVRLEHPQHLIDQIQYHSEEGRGKWLPAAEYSFVTQSDFRGVYTFCMCPGGVIVPAISDEKQIVVNGMSSSARSSKWANSGFVVEIHPGDIQGYENYGETEMLVLQEDLEKRFSEESHGDLNAPAQRIEDFINGRLSTDLPSTSYAPGIHSADLNKLFPLEIRQRLKGGLKEIRRKCPAFVSNDGIMIGLESRTSSPFRIPRDADNFQHVEIVDLYPMGEGAGYAGGIVSSAIDGIRCMDSYFNKLMTDGNHT